MRTRLTRLSTARLPRDLHPVAWWVWSLGLAACASFTTNPWILLLLIGVACLTVAARRSDQPWADAFRIYLWLGVMIVVVRVLFRVLLGGGDGGRVVLQLPVIPLPHWALGIRLLGDVTSQSVLAGLYDGLRLAAVVICVGAGNALANPKRLLRSVPPALYEIGSALVVAITVLPQLAESLRRVRLAQTLRGGDSGRVRGLRRLVVPVLEDALERSLALAAGMDTRGYGRSAGATPRERRTTGALMLAGLSAVCVGVYAALDRTTPAWLGRPMVVLGVVLSFVAVRQAGRRVTRTRYRPAPWRWPETVVACSGVLVGAAGWWMAKHQILIAYPSLEVAPTISLLALLVAAIGLGGALVAPHAAPGPGGGDMIELRRITFGYDDRTVLRGVDLRVEEGELVVVSGRTGVGKSTLLGVLTGLVPRFSGGTLAGDVVIDGESVVHRPPRERAHLVGYVGQDPAAGFVTDTVEEELAYGMEQLGLPEATMRRRVEETLDLLGIAALRGRDLRTLSGGEQQRVAIGAVLTMHPRVLVLDEPTSALDPTAAEEVLATLTRLVHDVGVSVLMAEHRLERVIPFADRLVLLTGDGGVVSGAPADVLASSAVVPPIVELGRALGWSPLPMTVRDARRLARDLDLGNPPPTPPPSYDEPVAVGDRLTVLRGQKVALHEASVRLPRGTVTALMGRNGSGKSTLLWTLQGTRDRRGGTVDVTGVDPAAEPAARRRALVGLVPQSAADLLYLETVTEECTSADGGSGECRVLLDTLVPGIPGDAHPRDLSEGQRLALTLAVVLVGSPPLVLLDEPTRGLDYPAKAGLAEVLRTLCDAGHAVLVATHDVEFAAAASDLVVVLAEGEVVSSGQTRQVLAESPAFAPQVTKILGPGWLHVREVPVTTP